MLETLKSGAGTNEHKFVDSELGIKVHHTFDEVKGKLEGNSQDALYAAIERKLQEFIVQLGNQMGDQNLAGAAAGGIRPIRE